MALTRILYIDNAPHERLAYLQSVRVWGGITPQPTEGLTSMHTAGLQIDWTQFSDVKRYIMFRIRHIRAQVASQLLENRMTLEMVQTLYRLVEAGFYELQELEELRVPLLQMLDGRGDSLGRNGIKDEPQDRFQILKTSDCTTCNRTGDPHACPLPSAHPLPFLRHRFGTKWQATRSSLCMASSGCVNCVS